MLVEDCHETGNSGTVKNHLSVIANELSLRVKQSSPHEITQFVLRKTRNYHAGRRLPRDRKQRNREEPSKCHCERALFASEAIFSARNNSICVAKNVKLS